jgi:TolB-like protein/DNA-binding winged helix-turn-helix (wHTH) protein/Tfp pilus assembly protein PilF
LATRPAEPPPSVKFGEDFEFNGQAYELRSGGIPLKLKPIPMQLLLFLIERRGELVTRGQIVERIWGKGVFLDSDNSINGAISKIRQALRDNPEQPRFVQTVSGKGYRFIAPVEEFDIPSLGAGAHREPVITPPVLVKRDHTWIALGLIVFAIVAGGLTYWLLQRSSQNRRAAALAIHSLAVLPLNNLSGDPSQEYFADGMTDELTTDLAKLSSLRVTSRTSAMRYKESKKGIADIARELHVDGVVEGSVMRSGDRVRITAQLIQAATDQHLWAETYEGDLSDVLTLQGNVARAIAEQVRAQLTPQQQSHLRSAQTVDPEAYEAYLRGLHYLMIGYSTPNDLRTAMRYFEESIRKDPGFALAYVSLADSYVYLGGYRLLSPEEAYRPAREAVAKALELDDSIAEAHTTLAMLAWSHERDWAAAEREYNAAVAMAPNYAWGHSNRSDFLAWQGKRAEALAENSRSRELDPGYSFIVCESSINALLRDYPKLIEVSQRGVVLEPNEWLEHYFLGVGYEGVGRHQEAIREYQKSIEMSGGDQDPTAALAHLYGVVGRRADAEKILHDLERKSKTSYVSAYMIATIYAGLGDKDKAFESLEKAYRDRSWDITRQIKTDLRLDSLRSDPRFQNLLRRVGIPN